MSILFYAFVVYYLTQVLLFDPRKAGPFLSKRVTVVWREVNELDTFILNKRPAAFFDYLRRPFGLYQVTRDEDKTEVWRLKEPEFQLWLCPHCLGFWVALVVALGSLVWHQDSELFFFVWFASAGINSFLVRFHES